MTPSITLAYFTVIYLFHFINFTFLFVNAFLILAKHCIASLFDVYNRGILKQIQLDNTFQSFRGIDTF